MQLQANRKIWLSAEAGVETLQEQAFNWNLKTDSEITFLLWRAMLCTFRVQDLALILASSVHTFWGYFS